MTLFCSFVCNSVIFRRPCPEHKNLTIFFALSFSIQSFLDPCPEHNNQITIFLLFRLQPSHFLDPLSVADPGRSDWGDCPPNLRMKRHLFLHDKMLPMKSPPYRNRKSKKM